ncbi:MAG: nuclear transport factor 2 family protein [Actinomycetaceae bacterium]|nr:nuclear transport factor 2 family protein [Actinomycetaceae bacterium]
MSTSAPLDIAQTYMNAVTSGDLATAVSTFAADIIWYQPGHHHLSGAHSGVEAIGTLIGAMVTETEGTFRLEVASNPMVNGEWVAFPVHFSGEKDGRTLDMDGIDLLRIDGDKIVEVRLFSASQADEDIFWG